MRGLSIDADRTKGIWYLSKDGKRCFRLNTSVEHFEDNKRETTNGFEVVDWFDFEKLNEEQYVNFINRYNNDKERRTIDRCVQAIEREIGTYDGSDGLLANRITASDYAGLDKKTLQGESDRGRDNRDSRSDYGESEVIQTFTTPSGEVYGFVDKEGNIYLDKTKIEPKHPIHEYTHVWDRMVRERNPELWNRGVELMKAGVPTLWA